MKTKKQLILPIVAVIILVALDQLTKIIASLFLMPIGEVAIIKNVFVLRYLENNSAAFSLDPVTILDKIFHFKAFQNNPALFLHTKMIFFVILTVVILVIVAIIYKKIPQTKRFLPLNITIIALFSGAIGNCIDRIWHNYVVDFFYFELIDFPVFNVADIYVSLAAVSLLILVLFVYKDADYKKIFPPKKNK